MFSQKLWVLRQPTPVFLPGETHGQRSLVGYTPQSMGSWRVGHDWVTNTCTFHSQVPVKPGCAGGAWGCWGCTCFRTSLGGGRGGPVLWAPLPSSFFPKPCLTQHHVDGWREASVAPTACGSSWRLLPNAGHGFPQSPKCLAAAGQWLPRWQQVLRPPCSMKELLPLVSGPGGCGHPGV